MSSKLKRFMNKDWKLISFDGMDYPLDPDLIFL